MTTIPPIYYFGYPGDIGGAQTECYALVRFLKRHGCDVRLVPTWNDPHPEFQPQMDTLGIPTFHARELHLAEDLPDLRGSICLSLCNHNFTNILGRLHVQDCRTIWVPCMCFTTAQERRVFNSTTGFPHAVVFQSQFQKRVLESEYKRWGYNTKHRLVIHGVFDLDNWTYSPRPYSPLYPELVVGRCARPDDDKWPKDLWPVYDRVGPVSAIVMGVSEQTAAHIGQPPHWGQALPPRALPVSDYYRHLDAFVTWNGNFNSPLRTGALENWPRVALECFAQGVPVVAPDAYGWPEMIIPGETGLLASEVSDIPTKARLLYTREYRQHLAANARTYLETELANEDVLWSQWSRLLSDLSD